MSVSYMHTFVIMICVTGDDRSNGELVSGKGTFEPKIQPYLP